jgi:hypothetical protein
MLVSPFVLGISELYPDFILTNIHWERLQVIAFMIEASSTFQIEATAMPVTGQNTVPDRPTGQGVTHMGALVISRIDPAINVKQCDAPPFSELDGLRFTPLNLAER